MNMLQFGDGVIRERTNWHLRLVLLRIPAWTHTDEFDAGLNTVPPGNPAAIGFAACRYLHQKSLGQFLAWRQFKPHTDL